MLILEPSVDNVLDHMSVDHLNLLFVGEKSALNIEELIFTANMRNIILAGGIYPGVIHQNHSYDDGIILIKLEKKTKIHLVKELNKNAPIKFPEVSEDIHSVIVLIDGLTNSVSEFLESAYEQYWDTLQFMGGGCGSITLQQQPCVFTNEGFFQDAALMVLLSKHLRLGVNHGWEKVAGPFVVSAVQGNVIKELNWRPAFEVYKEEVASQTDVPINEANFFDLAKGYPFGIFREGMEDIVRDPVATDQQSLTCIGEVSLNSVVNIMTGKIPQLINGAQTAAQEAILSGPVESVFIVDCVSRAMFMGDDFAGELEVVSSIICSQNYEIPMEGVLSLGEISSYGNGYLEFFNKTIVVGAFQTYDR